MAHQAVFLDRDGVLNEADSGPPNHAGQLHLLPGVGEAISELNRADLRVFVVTNQGGVGLGYMTEKDLTSIHEKLVTEVAKDGGRITEVVACIHRPRAGCACRKPKPGMLHTLAEKHGIDLKGSFMVGDRETDLLAGREAGTRTVLVASKPSKPGLADHVALDLPSAVPWIVDQL